MVAVRVKDDLRAVIKEYSCCIVAQVVAKPVLRAIVDPLTDPDLMLFGMEPNLDPARRTQILSVSEAVCPALLDIPGPISC